jgi:lysophospholipase L1-like esterase
VLVSNASVNGRTTRQALEDMPYSVQSPGVDVLLVQFGLNDCNYWATDRGLPRVSLGAYRENLREIVSRGLRFGAKVVFLNNNHPTTRAVHIMPNTEITYEQSNAEYCAELRDLVNELPAQVVFNDVHRYFTNLVEAGEERLEDLLLEDGLHLSGRGHDVYYRLMAPAVIAATERLIADRETGDF